MPDIKVSSTAEPFLQCNPCSRLLQTSHCSQCGAKASVYLPFDEVVEGPVACGNDLLISGLDVDDVDRGRTLGQIMDECAGGEVVRVTVTRWKEVA